MYLLSKLVAHLPSKLHNDMSSMKLAFCFLFFVFSLCSAFAENFASLFDVRIWTARNGDKISAIFEKVSCDGRFVWIVNQANKKSIKCDVSLLSAVDKKYVRNSIDTLKSLGAKSFQGVLKQPSLATPKNEFALMSSSHMWHDRHGNKLEASWDSVSEDGHFIWLTEKKPSSRSFMVAVSMLSKTDVDFVNNLIEDCKKYGAKWIDGVWMAPETVRDMNYTKHARSLVNKNSPKELISYRVRQVIDCGALCVIGKELKYSHDYIYDGPWFYWNVGRNNMIASDEEHKNRKFFWAGTYTYTTVKGSKNTVLCYVEDFDTAVYLVRGNLGLFDKGDSRFSKFDSSPSVPPIKQPTPSPVSSDNLLCYGSGFFVSPDGYIVTNHHVVDGGSRFVVLNESKELIAKLVAKDIHTDLALLKVEGRFDSISCASLHPVRLGQDIFVMGFPRPSEQGFSPKITKGVISSLNGFNDDATRYQIDASIQPGNSGGPVCTADGRLVAVVVSSLKDKYFLDKDGAVPQNVNYAIKGIYLKAFLDTIPAVSKMPSFDTVKSDRFEDAVDFVRKRIVLIKVY